jgi:hypothetical protein
LRSKDDAQWEKLVKRHHTLVCKDLMGTLTRKEKEELKKITKEIDSAFDEDYARFLEQAKRVVK